MTHVSRTINIEVFYYLAILYRMKLKLSFYSKIIFAIFNSEVFAALKEKEYETIYFVLDVTTFHRETFFMSPAH